MKVLPDTTVTICIKRLAMAVVCVFTMFSALVGVPAFAQSVTLDKALDTCVSDLSIKLPAGTRIACPRINAGSPELADYITGKLTARLIRDTRFVVINRDTKAVDTELTYQLRGSVSDEAASSITAQLGAEVVIAGSLQKAGAANPPAYRLDIKAILDVADSSQVETGRADYESIADGIALMAEPVCTAAAVVPANMVLVPAGTFAMGSTNGYDREKPVHQVSISKPFYISKYEITQKEWTAVMGSNPSYFKGDTLPVEQVSWFDAVEYCNKRSQKEGLTPVYSGSGAAITCNFNANGYRLPTEAEWEWAAKGGGKDGPMYEYAGGNDVNSVGWYDANSGVRTHEAGTHEVGTKAPNSLGIYDMSGNVWEWCWDWYGDYSGGSQTDPIGAASESDRVVRGGGWGDYAQYLRSASRYGNTPTDDRAIDVGFRVVRP